MSTISLKESIVILLHHANKEEQVLREDLNEEKRITDTGNAQEQTGQWARKELLMHLTAVKQRQINRLLAVARGEVPLSGSHYTDQIFESYRDYTWQKMKGKTAQVFTRLVEQVEGCGEEQLEDTLRYSWLDGQSLAQQILTKCVWHSYGHLTAFYSDQGDVERAVQLHAELVAEANRVNMHPLTHGSVTYNLACMKARTKQFDAAIGLLSRAIALYPALATVAGEDTDFDELREQPAFQILFSRIA